MADIQLSGLGSVIKTAYEAEADTNAVTDAEKTVLGNTSGANSGDMSDAAVKTAYENNADTNALTDAEKTVLSNTSNTNTGDQTLAFSADVDTQITPVTPIVLDHASNNEVALNLAYTTNKAAGDDTGLVVNQTDTASPGTSKAIDVQQGGISKAYFDNNGQLVLPTVGVTGGLFFGDGDSGIYEDTDDSLTFRFAGANRYTVSGPSIIGLLTDTFALYRIAATSTTPPYAFNGDSNTGIGRAAADQLSLIAGGVEGIRVTESAGSIVVEVTDSLTVDGDEVITFERRDIAFSDETTALTTGDDKATFHMPNYATTLLEVSVGVTTAPTGSAAIFDLEEAGTTVLSTLITIDAGDKTSEDAGTAPVISDSALAANALMTVNVDQIGSSVAGTGAKLYIKYKRA